MENEKYQREVVREDHRKHPLEHKLAAYYHRMGLVRTLAPLGMLFIQTIVLFLQLAIASKIFNVPLGELTHITQVIDFFDNFVKSLI